MLSPDAPLGPYRLVEKIGAGGMGEVWKAEDPRLGRMVAIKILPTAVAADPEAVARLKREARTAAQLYHPNIATIHSIEQDGDRLFIVMELVIGEPLSHVMRRGAMPEADLCRVARGVADALAAAHEKGIVHRDIKPDNVIVSGSRVKVLDFGIAKQVGVEMETPQSADAPTAFMTQRGVIVGTVHYMSPEQALGKALDSRTDLFSLGVVMYQAATGRLPFSGETITETITQIVRDEPDDPRTVNAAISAGLSAIIQRCMRKKREERFASADELVAALDAQLGQAPTAPHTDTSAPTVPYSAASAASAPTAPYTAASHGASAPTVVARTASRNARWIPALIVALIAVLAGAYLIGRREALPVETRPSETQASAPASTTVNVTAAPNAQSATPPTNVAPPVIHEQAPTPPKAPGPASGSAAPAPVPGSIPMGAPSAPPPGSAPPRTAPVSSPSLDQQYDNAVRTLRDGDWMRATDELREIVRADPHYARAHIRLGQISLATRKRIPARNEFELALADPDRLDDRERQLARIGLALSLGQRALAAERFRELRRAYPDDPDVLRFEQELGAEGPRPPLRGGPRRRRP